MDPTVMPHNICHHSFVFILIENGLFLQSACFFLIQKLAEIW